MESISDSQTFPEFFLGRLQTIFDYLQPGKIKAEHRDGMLFFKQKYTRICLYNVYPGSVQIIFNRNLLSGHFEAAHDYAASAPIDWELIMFSIIDILEKSRLQEKEDLRSNSNLSRSNKTHRSIVKGPEARRANCV